MAHAASAAGYRQITPCVSGAATITPTYDPKYPPELPSLSGMIIRQVQSHYIHIILREVNEAFRLRVHMHRGCQTTGSKLHGQRGYLDRNVSLGTVRPRAVKLPRPVTNSVSLNSQNPPLHILFLKGKRKANHSCTNTIRAAINCRKEHRRERLVDALMPPCDKATPNLSSASYLRNDASSIRNGSLRQPDDKSSYLSDMVSQGRAGLAHMPVTRRKRATRGSGEPNANNPVSSKRHLWCKAAQKTVLLP